MFESRVLRRACGHDSLPLWLLVSLLLHLSLIAPPLLGRAAGGEHQARDFRPSSLRASLNDSASPSRAVQSAPEPTLAQAADEASRSAGPQRRAGLPFYPSAALTIRPVALSEPLLDDGDTVAGELVLWIDDRGAVVEVSAGRSDPPSARLRAVADAFRRVRFSPGELNGKKVGAVMRIAVSYDDERLPIEP